MRSLPLYDSRDTPARGIGFPSCSRELARRAPNTRDPHGYYSELGVRPDASMEEIRAAVRRLFFELHPDTGAFPDVERLQRVKNIGAVLLDPVSRETYNRTPQGQRLMDAVYEAELSKLDELHGLDEEQVRVVLQPQKTEARRTGRFDYFALDHRDGDSLLAALWYHQLIAVAPMARYRSTIKVLIYDGSHADFNEQSRIMTIPRHWQPSSALAFAMFTVVV